MQMLDRARLNYVLYHGMPPNAAETLGLQYLHGSFGGVEGWAAVTDEAAREECLRPLEEALAAHHFCNRALLLICQRNEALWRRAMGRESNANILEGRREHRPASWLRWALPTFALAKEGYEAFRGARHGSARLREVLASSAGVAGWELFAQRQGAALLLSLRCEPSAWLRDEEEASTSCCSDTEQAALRLDIE